MSKGRRTAHQNPVWREKADFLIAALVDPDSPNGDSEQLWAARRGEDLFEICCIPFFTYGLALGDVVATDESYLVIRVAEESGRRTYRVWFGDSFHPRNDVASRLVSMGSLIEWSSTNLLAVDAEDAEAASIVEHYLQAEAEAGRLIFEPGF